MSWQNHGVVVEDAWNGINLGNCFIVQAEESDDEFLCAYRHHINCTNSGGPIPMCSHYRLRLHASTDGGTTWALRSTIADHNRTHAVWEPFLFHAPNPTSGTRSARGSALASPAMALPPRAERGGALRADAPVPQGLARSAASEQLLHVAYSRERPRPGHPGDYAQDVVQRVSSDGGRSWQDGFLQIQTTPESRNGMPQCIPLLAQGAAATAYASAGAIGGWICVFEGFWGQAGWGSFTVQFAMTTDPTAMGGWNHTQLVYAPGDLPGTTGRKAGSPAVAVCPQSGKLAIAFITDDEFSGTPPSDYTGACQVRGMVSLEPLAKPGQTLSFPSRPQATLGAAVPSLWPQMLVPASAPAAVMTVFQTPLAGGGVAAVSMLGGLCGSE